MEPSKRNITIYTPNKVYRGEIDIANESLRTIDIFNSSNIYWKNPTERSFEDALMLHGATILLDGHKRLGDFARLQVRLSDILFFHDSLENLGDSMEKRRAGHLKVKTGETSSLVHIITRTMGDAFYYVTGTFHGLFKSKSQHRYIPMTHVNVVKIIRMGDKWQKKNVPLESGFIGISTQHIEACTFKDHALG